MTMPADLIDQANEFTQRFGAAPDGVWAGPGRVNLIGEHTDNHDGFVLPFAIDRCARVAVRLRSDDLVRCASMQGQEAVQATLSGLAPGSTNGWAAYVWGVAWALREAGVALSGFDLLVDSDIPIGSGLSSSAALQVATGLALVELTGALTDRLELALLCHRAETEFVGVPVGVMDQIAVSQGVSGHALLVDCRSLDIRPIRFRPHEFGCSVVLLDTGVRHANSDGAYAERRTSCDKAAAGLGLPTLRDASLSDLLRATTSLGPVLTRRARHVVTENQRVQDAAVALATSDLPVLGELLLDSHASLRDDFEVSCPELDLAVVAALSAGAYGARLTGAGFGGCVLALVPTDRTALLAQTVQEAFAAGGLNPPEIFPVRASDGARRLR